MTDRGSLVASRYGEVFFGPPDSMTFQARMPGSWTASRFQHPLIGRALRSDRCVVAPMAGGALLAVHWGQVSVLRDGIWRLLGDLEGRAPLHSRLARDREGWVYIPEWWANRARGEVRLWRVDPEATTMEIAHVWPPGGVRHLHSVVADPYDEGVLWATSGDEDGECYLWRSVDRFQTVERWGDGTQNSRAVFLWFTPERVGWLTDTERTHNHTCWMTRSTGDLCVGQSLPGPIWHGTGLRDGGWIATTTVEKGPGVKDRHSRVLGSMCGEVWTEHASWRKDLWRPHRVFGHGILGLPAGEQSSGRVWMDASGLSGRAGVFSMNFNQVALMNP